MRRSLLMLLALAFGSYGHAQLTTITATHIYMGGTLIPTGTVTFTPVNSAGAPIPFSQGGGGLNAPTAFPCSVANGAITGTCQIPDSALTGPANILYSVTVTKTSPQWNSSPSSFTMNTVAGITGTTWALDAYAPPAPTSNVQPVQMSYGTAAAPSPCVSPSFYIRNNSGGQLYMCVAGVPVQVTGGVAGLADPGSNGIVKRNALNTTTVATAGTDYVVPGGNVATATALAGSPNQCTGGQFATGIGSNGNANCGTPAGGAAETISNLVFSQDDTTIVATWYTSGASNSALTCGGVAAVDNNVQSAVTFHQAIVTGLSPSTLYSCGVTSGATSSTAQNVTTTAAATRTPLTSVSFGSPTTTGVHGDTVDSFISNDNKTYVTEDDGYGFTGSPNAGANMQVGVLTTESTLTGTLVNLLTSYGAFDTSTGTDGPSGAAQTNKLSGIFSMSGTLYLWANRDQYGTTGNLTQTAWYGSIMKSTDHGATWNSFVNPSGAPNANGVAPTGTPPTPYMFGLSTIGWCAPVRYAADDGTLGYLTAGNRIDGANAFVYLDCTDGWFINSNNLYLLRIPRAQMANQNPGAVQYWVGPSSPAPTQFVNPSNWSNSASGLTAIYSATGQTDGADLIFVPGVNYYVLATWYNPGTIGGTQTSSNSTWNVFAGPTPAGPVTNIGSQNNNPAGYYNPTALHRTFASNTVTSNIPVTYVYSGDYNTGNATYYYPTHSVFTFNQSSSYTSPTYRTACNNTPSAGATTTVNCSLTATAGDFLFVLCRGGENTTQTVTTSPSGTFTQMGQVNNSSGSSQASYSFGANGGSTTFTCTAPGGGTTYQGIQVLDYAPGSITSLAAGSGNTINSSTSTFTSSAVSVTGSAFYIVCGDAQYGPPTITVGTINGSTATGRTLSSPSSACEDQSVATTTSGATGTLNASSAGAWDGVIAVFH